MPPSTIARVAPRRSTSAATAGESCVGDVSRMGASRAPARAEPPSASGQLNAVAITTVSAPSGNANFDAATAVAIRSAPCTSATAIDDGTTVVSCVYAPEPSYA